MKKERQLELIRKLRAQLHEYSYVAYSGRGSFGSKWPGFNVDKDIHSFLADVVRSKITDDLNELAELIEDAVWDSPIIYWWRVKLTEPEDLRDETEIDEDDDYEDEEE